MKKRLFIVSIVLIVIIMGMGVKWIRSKNNSENGEKDATSENSNEDAIIVDKCYDSDGLLIVSIETCPSLFEIKTAEADLSKPQKDLLIGYYENSYVNDDNVVIHEDYKEISIYDENIEVIKDKLFDGFNIIQHCDEPEEIVKEDVIVEFMAQKANAYIDELYVLILPEQVKVEKENKKVDNYLGLYNIEKVSKIVYPKDYKYVYINGAYELETLECSHELISCSINDCPKLAVDLKMVGDDNTIKLPSNFYNCDKVTSFKMPDSVVYITSFFNGCDSLEEYKINDGVIMITESFNNNVNLQKIYIPDTVKIILNCFKDCENITLSVGEGTAGEEYAIANGIKYEYH